MRSFAQRTRVSIGAVGTIGACALSFAVAALGLAACLDMTTVEFVAPVPDASPPPPVVDAGPDVPDVDTRPPCDQCLASPDQPGPGCADELAACLADTKCHAMYECVVAQQCLTKGSQKKIILCGLPCAESAGIVTQDEPAVVFVLAVVSCLQSACAVACKIGDAGAVTD